MALVPEHLTDPSFYFPSYSVGVSTLEPERRKVVVVPAMTCMF